MRRWMSAPPSQGARTGHPVVPVMSSVSASPLPYNSVLFRYACCCSGLLSAPGSKLLFVGPTTQSLSVLFLQLFKPSLLICHWCSIFWLDNPSQHLSMDHGKPLVSGSLHEVTFLSEPLLAVAYPSPPVSGPGQMKWQVVVTSTGLCCCRHLAVQYTLRDNATVTPLVASKQMWSMTAWWY